jgi:DNA-directed RNA polymerase subunit M/transcription elongation factor TFIIS
MKFCPKCHYRLSMASGKITTESRGAGAAPTAPAEEQDILIYKCVNCGYEDKDVKGGLIVETILQESTSEGYKILLNEFTRYDPTLPHVKNIKCPTATCATNTTGQERDIILVKYDSVNMKYIYICNVCATEWRSRS